MSVFAIDETHDPTAICWVANAARHRDFPVQNLPFGIFSPRGGEPRAGVAIGGFVLDLRAANAAGLLGRMPEGLIDGITLNALLAAPAERRALRRSLFRLLTDPTHRDKIEPLLTPIVDCALHLPAAIGDYTDFYVGIHHATNVGKQFRPDTPLLPNYKYVPIGYHGRASSIRPSGVPVVRPWGQRKPAEAPIRTPTVKLDYELELGIWIGAGNPLGSPIDIAVAADHVGGYCLLNDWSARDIQAWEYQPLGPFLAKNFQSTVSPWIVTAEALAPFRTAQPARPEGDPAPLPYLDDAEDQRRGALSVEMEAALLTARMREAGQPPHRLSRGSATAMYWTVAQIVTHHASNGCNLNPGDLIGTGTISGADDTGLGSLLEIGRNGAAPITLPNGETRAFVEDGDEIILSARGVAEGFVSIGFGECRAMVTAARER